MASQDHIGSRSEKVASIGQTTLFLVFLFEFDSSLFPWFQYNLMTMVVLVTGHQMCCILWEQAAIFNKGIFCCFFFQHSLHWIYFVNDKYNQIYVRCCKNTTYLPSEITIKSFWTYRPVHLLCFGKGASNVYWLAVSTSSSTNVH